MIWWPIIVLIIIIFIIWSENGSQNCLGKNCSHLGKLESTSDLGSKQIIDQNIQLQRRLVTAVAWRRAMLITIVLAIVLALILFPTMPSGLRILIISIPIFLLIYFAIAWNQYKNKLITDQIEIEYYHLRNKIINSNVSQR